MAGQSSFVLAFVFAAAIVGAYAAPPEKLVRGTDAPNHKYPFMVSLRIQGQHFCGGAIVAPQFILTAAHCVEAAKTMPFGIVTAVTGTNRLDQGGESHKVTHYLQHSSYVHGAPGRTWNYDLGAMKLAAPIKYNSVQKAIALPVGPPDYSKPATVVAWGATAWPPTGVSNNLQELTLPLLTLEKCQPYHTYQLFSDLHICALKTRGTGTCSGDSGSPMIQGNHLIAVVSGGIPCALGKPDVFSNIYKMMDFVHGAMKY